MFTERTISVNNLDIASLTWGDGPQTILCLHGWLDNSLSFERLAPQLSKHYRVIAVDLPGHGLSAHLPQASYYHLIDGVSHILEIISSLKLENFILLGHSLGGCLASLAASQLNNKLSQLICLDALGPISDDPESAEQNYHTYMKTLAKLRQAPKKPYASVEDAIRVRAEKGYIDESLVKGIVTRGIMQERDSYVWRHDPRLMLPSPLRMTETQVLSFLNAVTVPTLLISATKGFHYEKDKVEGRLKSVSQLSHVFIEGGHHIHLEQPEKTAEEILTFLKN